MARKPGETIDTDMLLVNLPPGASMADLGQALVVELGPETMQALIEHRSQFMLDIRDLGSPGYVVLRWGPSDGVRLELVRLIKPNA